LSHYNLTPLVRNREIAINQIVNIIAQITAPMMLANVLPAKIGAITPAESQATAALVKNSARDFLCPIDNFFIKSQDNIKKLFLSSFTIPAYREVVFCKKD